jgi:hypothetical protein
MNPFIPNYPYPFNYSNHIQPFNYSNQQSQHIFIPSQYAGLSMNELGLMNSAVNSYAQMSPFGNIIKWFVYLLLFIIIGISIYGVIKETKKNSKNTSNIIILCICSIISLITLFCLINYIDFNMLLYIFIILISISLIIWISIIIS